MMETNSILLKLEGINHILQIYSEDETFYSRADRIFDILEELKRKTRKETEING